MGFRQISEFGLIQQIQRRFSSRSPSSSVHLGIGDDAAAIETSSRKYTLLTTDSLVENIHFDRRFATFFQVGYKAVSVNVSDIAAMGGIPTCFLVSLGLSEQMRSRDIDQLYRGIAKASEEVEIQLVGGNTSASSGPFFVTVTLIGEVLKKKLIRRSGAKEGDFLYVTGTLGDAAAGLACLKNGLSQKGFGPLIRRQKTPAARWKEGKHLGDGRLPSAMIDISDSLSADLNHLLQQSEVGAQLQRSQIPISTALRRYASQTGGDAMDYALNGGEDYELLFSLPEENIPKLERLIKKGVLQATKIGRITSKNKGFVLKSADGKIRKIVPRGHDHLRKKSGKDL